MSINSKDAERLGDLERRLVGAERVTAELVLDMMASGCVRLAALGAAAQAKLRWLIEAGAWTDAAMALLELELPQWKLRRLVRHDNEWFCSLSRRPGVPIGYDEIAEATHESLPLAILVALIQARRAANVSSLPKGAVPQIRPPAGNCCDNFA
jgi:hypothetical protein